MKQSEAIQKLLPLGYLYLVILGIIKESVYYYQFGINILKYSTLMDVLLGPISDITSHPLMVGFVIFLVGIFYLVYAKKDTAFAQKMVNYKPNNSLSKADQLIQFNQKYFGFVAVWLLCFFLGVGYGLGHFKNKRIQENRLTYNNRITFNTGDTITVHNIGSNSIYYFYKSNKDSVISITPVAAIKKIDILPKK